jgi:hypothetical protein
MTEQRCYLMRMIRAVVALLVLLAVGCQQAQPVATADDELWMAALEQVRQDLQADGGLAIVNQTIPTADLHALSPDAIRRERRLVDLLRQRNESKKAITGLRLPPRTRLVDANSVQNWDATKFPGEKLVRFSLPAIVEGATTKGIVYYSATGGFDDSRGAYIIFLKREGQWAVVDYLYSWIT